MRTAEKSTDVFLVVIALILLIFSSCSPHKQSESSGTDESSAAESSVQPTADAPVWIEYPRMQSDLEPIAEPVDISKLYYRSQLSPEEQQLYDFLLYYAERQDTRAIHAPDFIVYQLTQMIGFVGNDNPQLFWASGDIVEWHLNGTLVYNLDYLYDRGQTVEMQKAVDSKTESILTGIHPGQSDYDTELYLHDYIVQNCTYDNSKSKANDGNIYGALIDKEPVCSGYAKVMQYLLLESGIPCLYVTGTASDNVEDEGHAWNIAFIDDAYYQLDVTWDDPDNEYISHRYFNVTTETMKNHGRKFDTDIEDREFTLPQCTSTQDNYYRKTEMNFSEYNNKLIEVLKTAVINNDRTKKPFIEISFTNKNAYKEAIRQLINKDGMWNIIDSVHSQCGNPIKDPFSYWNYDDDLLLVIELKYT